MCQSVSHRCHATHSGFTIVELMVVVAIAAVLMAIAVPSFQGVITRNRVETIQSQLASALAQARTEAATRNAVVSVCGSNGNQNCSTNNSWSAGWIVFVDTDLNGVRGDDEQVLEVYRQSTDYRLNAVDNSGNVAGFVSYGYSGFQRGLKTTLITVCDPSQNAKYARGLFVNAAGIVMKTRDGSDDDSIHDSPMNIDNDLTCN